jgi:GR25 family glycosyltransferase involved in LPS biosynthesis
MFDRVFVINLDRRSDKWEKTWSVLVEELDMDVRTVERVSAVDGAGRRLDQETMSPILLHLFRTGDDEKEEKENIKKERSNPYSDHGYRRGVLGCSLSHLKLWRKMSNDEKLEDDDVWMILEDDVALMGGRSSSQRRGRRDEWRLALLSLQGDSSWDWTYLAHLHDDDKGSGGGGLYDDEFVHPGIRWMGRKPRSYGGGTGGYLLRKRGARRLLRAARAGGMSQAVDWFMLEVGVGGRCGGGVCGERVEEEEEEEEEEEGRVYITSPLLLTTPGAMRPGASDTHEQYPTSVAMERARRVVERRVCERRRGEVGEEERRKRRLVSPPPPPWMPGFRDKILDTDKSSTTASGGQQQEEEEQQKEDHVVSRPFFLLALELEILSSSPHEANELEDGGKLRCSRVCLEVQPVLEDVVAGKKRKRKRKKKKKTSGYYSCRDVGRAGHPWRVPAARLGVRTAKVWMEDVDGFIISRLTERRLRVVDIASVVLSTSSISLYVARGDWNFQPDLYVMCGEFRRKKKSGAKEEKEEGEEEEEEEEEEEMFLLRLGCRPLHSKWTSEGEERFNKGEEGELRVSLMGVDGTVFGHSKWSMFVLGK